MLMGSASRADAATAARLGFRRTGPLSILRQNVEGRLGRRAIAVLYFARGLIAHYRYAFYR